MTTIKQQDFIDSVADALQFISYYHPKDFIEHLAHAYQHEQSPAAKDAMAQILTNSRMCAEGHRPICQDTGIVVAFVKVGMSVRWEANLDVVEMVNAGVRKAYLQPDNVLRASIVSDPAGKRKNTGDNTPAVVHIELVQGDKVAVRIAAKGGGSENKAVMEMLNPGDDIVEWVLQRVPEMGAGWCPPGMLGIGIGGTAEKAVLLAKEALMEPMDMLELKARGAQTRTEELRIELYDKINALCFTNHPQQTCLRQHHFGIFIHTRRGGRSSGSNSFISHRINRSDIINEAAIKIHAYRQFFTACQHFSDAFMSGIAPRQQLSR